MGSYVDSKERTWTFDVTYGFVYFLKNSFKVDLLEPYTNGNNTLEDLVSNNYTLLEVLFQVVKYYNKDVKDDEIWESFEGKEAEVTEAFFNDWANFSRKRGRKDIEALILKALAMLKAAIAAAEAEINTIDSTEEVSRIFQNIRESQKTSTSQSGK